MKEEIQEKIKKRVLEHGFLLEEEIKSILELNHWDCDSSSHFEDLDTGKSRETDIIASKIYSKEGLLVRFVLIMECKDLSDAILFFSTKLSARDQVYWEKRTNFHSPFAKVNISDSKIGIQEYLGINKLHHFFYPQRKATNFKILKIKGDYSFSEKEMYEELMVPLIKSLSSYNNETIRHTERFLRAKAKKYLFTIVVPVIVLRNSFYETYFKDNDLQVIDNNYLQIITDYKSKSVSGDFQIDVISKDFFEGYLKTTIDKTFDSIRKKIEDNLETMDRFGIKIA